MQQQDARVREDSSPAAAAQWLTGRPYNASTTVACWTGLSPARNPPSVGAYLGPSAEAQALGSSHSPVKPDTLTGLRTERKKGMIENSFLPLPLISLSLLDNRMVHVSFHFLFLIQHRSSWARGNAPGSLRLSLTPSEASLGVRQSLNGKPHGTEALCVQRDVPRGHCGVRRLSNDHVAKRVKFWQWRISGSNALPCVIDKAADTGFSPQEHRAQS
jgi:hypothetical protein